MTVLTHHLQEDTHIIKTVKRMRGQTDNKAACGADKDKSPKCFLVFKTSQTFAKQMTSAGVNYKHLLKTVNPPQGSKQKHTNTRPDESLERAYRWAHGRTSPLASSELQPPPLVPSDSRASHGNQRNTFIAVLKCNSSTAGMGSRGTPEPPTRDSSESPGTSRSRISVSAFGC